MDVPLCKEKCELQKLKQQQAFLDAFSLNHCLTVMILGV